jgi:gluconate 2-dehydrogenase gamma chain
VAGDAARIDGACDRQQSRVGDAAKIHFAKSGAIDALPKRPGKKWRGRPKKKSAPAEVHTLIILGAMHNKLSRRSLLGATFLAALPPEALQALQDHAHASANPGERKLRYLDPVAAAEIERLTSEIIPTDASGPGAKEARVVYFIDRALATFDADQRGLYRDGLASAHGKSAAEIEHTEFFESLRRHAIMGFLASPAWGGNRDKSGWKLIGFDDAGVFQPPFGYYDMPEHRG